MAGSYLTTSPKSILELVKSRTDPVHESILEIVKSRTDPVHALAYECCFVPLIQGF
jgi:hypothetical protein